MNENPGAANEEKPVEAGTSAKTKYDYINRRLCGEGLIKCTGPLCLHRADIRPREHICDDLYGDVTEDKYLQPLVVFVDRWSI